MIKCSATASLVSSAVHPTPAGDVGSDAGGHTLSAGRATKT